LSNNKLKHHIFKYTGKIDEIELTMKVNEGYFKFCEEQTENAKKEKGK